MRRVLFLCTGNSARSQMAEAFLRKYGGDEFEAHSAGLKPAGMNPLTVKVMQEVGVDVSGQHSKGVDVYLGKLLFQHLITVCADADKNCPTTWPGISKREHWAFDDPAAFIGTEAEKLAKFREVRDQIEARVKTWIDNLQ